MIDAKDEDLSVNNFCSIKKYLKQGYPLKILNIIIIVFNAIAETLNLFAPLP